MPENPQHREIVKAGGGVYCCTGGVLPGYVLFHNPATDSTLALTEQDLTADAVRTEIAKNNSDYRRAK